MSQTVAVVGAGYMGGGIAQVVALSGRLVSLADQSAAHAVASRERIIVEAADFASRGLFPADAAERIAAHVSASASIEEAVADADVIEEAVSEIPEVKQDILRRISAASRSDAVIGSNTSTISIARLAEAVEHPARFLGVHFSNPATFIPGVEVIPHAGTSAAAVSTVLGLLEDCGKVGVEIKDVTGFVLNRLQYALFTESCRLVEEGIASAEDIDRIARTTFGFRLPFFGPFAIADIAGLDVYAFCYRSLQEAYPDRFAPPVALEERVSQGRLGLKSGGGFLATPPERIAEITAYRDNAYAAMSELLERLGPAPVEY
ncbi:3-hydroxyacyl-CoA dehydrogenase family protein [Micromonospora sp. DT81.3]|uniref:3-hydroxyacyl-CoA dehydrogenase family protein n=1 Tax=Micromonospora sp. DT81.3 TaxID=3416523 RepID=UPI003CEAA0BA